MMDACEDLKIHNPPKLKPPADNFVTAEPCTTMGPRITPYYAGRPVIFFLAGARERAHMPCLASGNV